MNKHEIQAEIDRLKDSISETKEALVTMKKKLEQAELDLQEEESKHSVLEGEMEDLEFTLTLLNSDLKDHVEDLEKENDTT